MENDIQLDYEEEIDGADLVERDSTEASSSRAFTEDFEKEKNKSTNLTGDIPTHNDVSADEMVSLYEEMQARGGDFILRAVLVRGVDGMTAFDVEKIFAEFKPYRVEILKDMSALVYFTNRPAAALMMLRMCKRLRRVRGAKRVEEEGEVLESSEEEEEEGVLKEENGDDVEIIAKGPDHKPKQRSAQNVKIDVDVVQIPVGRWRVVTEHVADRRLLIIRFAKRDEIKSSKENRIDVGSDRKRKIDDNNGDPDSGWLGETTVRPGLNVFDERGKELEWDYEHDTRFFEGPEGPVNSAEDPEIKKWGADDAAPPKKIRGRGAARAHLLFLDKNADTMRADTESKTAKKGRELNAGSESRLSGDVPLDKGHKSTRWIRGQKITFDTENE
ncbi:unnamed protein product, partial [Mesorhabditis belari]|uniref:Uncharacterized protein n=1 Tax=Mesorhabditis belari TaxID=2138241 RepID=A0AAF3EJ49_9BILA